MADIIQERVVLSEVHFSIYFDSVLLLYPAFVVQILVKNCSNYQGYTGEGQVIEGNVPIIEDRLTTIRIVEAVYYLRNGENHIFVEEVEDHFTDSNVAPPPMHHDKLPQSLEFWQSIILKKSKGQ